MVRKLTSGALVAALSIAIAAPSEAAFYDGKTITVIVGLSVGGTTMSFSL